MPPESNVVLLPDPKDEAWIEQLKEAHPHDIATQLELLPVTSIRQVLRRLPDEQTAEIISEMPLHLQVKLFEVMRLQRLSGIVPEMFTDDAADVLGNLSTERLRAVMGTLSDDDARELGQLIEFPEDSAGGIMRTEFIAVPEDVTIRDAIDQLRNAEHDENTFYIYVTDDNQRLRGVLKMRDLLFRKPELMVKDVMITEVRCMSVHADQEEIGRIFRDYHYLSLPVVDDFQRLRGVITGDDVALAMEEEATEDMQKMVGLSGEENIATPWTVSISNRLPWLTINLATAFLAGWVVSLYEATLQQYAALAIFLPIIAGQGGNAGTQTLTIVVRSIALGDLRAPQQRGLLIKELIVGLLAGLSTGFLVGLVAWLWMGNPVLGVVVSVSMLLTMLVAALAGVVIPLSLRALNVDPALAASILLTTVTDVVGFFLFLGIATMMLAYMGLPS